MDVIIKCSIETKTKKQMIILSTWLTLLNEDFVEENEGHLEIESSNTETNIKGIGGQAIGKTVEIKLRKRGGTSETKFTAVIVPDITTIWRKNLEPFEKLV